MTRKTPRKFGKIRRLPSGHYQAQYAHPDQPSTYIRAPHTFDTEGDADTWLTTVRADIVRGAWLPPEVGKPTRFGTYAEAWLAGRKVNGRPLADRTRDQYRSLLDRFILPTFDEVPLGKITPEAVDAWYETTATDTPTYRAQAYSLLRTILGTAVDRGLIRTANPAKVRGAGRAKRAKRIKPATLADLETITEAMPEHHRLMVLLAAWCALRFGELAELRRRDVDAKRGMIHVRRGVIRSKSVGVKIKAPKTDAGERDVAIPPHLMPMVKAHLLAHTAPGRDGLLFPARNGGTLAPSAFYGKPAEVGDDGEIRRKGHGWYEARRVAGREDLRFHDLRHTGAVLAAQTGATLAELMARLGHSTPGAAMRYQHAAEDRDLAIARRLSEMATGQGG